MVNIPISHDLDGFIHVGCRMFFPSNGIMEGVQPPKVGKQIAPPPLNFVVKFLGRPTTQFRPRISGEFWSNLLKVKWPKVEKHLGDPPTMPFETCPKNTTFWTVLRPAAAMCFMQHLYMLWKVPVGL